MNTRGAQHLGLRHAQIDLIDRRALIAQGKGEFGGVSPHLGIERPVAQVGTQRDAQPLDARKALREFEPRPQ